MSERIRAGTQPPRITQELVRELLDYFPRKGELYWRERGRHHFPNDAAWRRWNARYSGQPAFTYQHGGYRWGSILDNSMLAHRVIWLHVHGKLPTTMAFKDGNGTNLRLANLIDTSGTERVRIAA